MAYRQFNTRTCQLLVAIAAAAMPGCSGEPDAHVATQTQALISDIPADPELPVVLLETAIGQCTGTLLSPRRILTAGHCLPEEAVTAVVVRTARSEEPCLSGLDELGACSTTEFVVRRSEDIDAGIIESPMDLTAFDYEFPRFRRLKSEEFFSPGYASDDARPDPTRPVQAAFSTEFKSEDSIVARTSARVCSGDSGMPAFSRSRSGKLRLHGVLTSSEPATDGSNCTDTGQVQHWGRGEALRRLIKGIEEPTIPPVETDFAEIELGLEQLGAKFLDNREEASEHAASVGIKTPGGEATAVLDEVALGELLVEEQEAEAGGGFEPIVLVPRALSDDKDGRKEYFVQEVGKVSNSGRCTGTLIGPRLVRTAIHCLDTEGWPSFHLMYHGGSRTVSYDGGKSWVTHKKKSVQKYYYGGKWYSKGCTNYDTRFKSGRTSFDDCLQEDWAILVLHKSVWSDINAVPRYMGYKKASLRSVKNTGYPSSGDVSSSNISNPKTGKMYGQSNCYMHKVGRSGALGWTSCDTTPGHSGGPTFYTSNGSNYLLADESARDTGMCSGTKCPSAVSGNNTWLLNFMTSLRSQFGSYSL